MTLEIFALLIGFQIKHLLADYYWQFPYMYLNKGAKSGWIEPLTLHALVHAGITLIILSIFFMILDVSPTFEHKAIIYVASLYDFASHFIIDRWKATRGTKPDEAKFWTDLGIDQMLHHVVGIIIIYGVYVNI